MTLHCFKIFIISLLLSISWTAATTAAEPTTFTLKGVRSLRDYGPFEFRQGAMLKLESGMFKINMLPDNKAFTLVDTLGGLTYGVYELVLGRMIDIGDVLFTITRINVPPPLANGSQGAPSIFDDTELAIELALVNQVSYNWEINGASGGDDVVDRRQVAVKGRKGIFTMQIGLVTASEWDHTIAGDGATFERAELSNGSGWFAGAGLKAPVLEKGRWRATLQGEAFYRSEELSLGYGAWEIESITSITDTNAITNVVTVIENRRFNQHDQDVTLTETLISIGAELAYNAPYYFFYGGLRALPWSETSLDAVITSDDTRYELTFERKDPVMAYGGIGLNIRGIKAYVEVQGGGETAVNTGISRSF